MWRGRVILPALPMVAGLLLAAPAPARQLATPDREAPQQAGPAARAVPEVRGKPLAEAERILRKAGFRRIEVRGSRAREARVRTQKPQKGKRVSPDTRVILGTVLQRAGPASGTLAQDGPAAPGATKRLDRKKGEILIVGSKRQPTSAVRPPAGKTATPPVPGAVTSVPQRPRTFFPPGRLTMTGLRFTPRTLAPAGTLTMTGTGFSPLTLAPAGALTMTGTGFSPVTLAPAGTLTMTGTGFSPTTISPAGTLKMTGTREP